MMIKQLALVFYLMFFVVALYLAAYNVLYLKGMEKTMRYTGFGLPKKIGQAVRINVLLSVITLFLIGVFSLAR
ncbi:hypothetical protein A3G67_00610 [Candidatus Roizmanbacteria bacterium RIFCSPLOWO2_12_FULL_40_12]|nr:MAG: hypothetical protein A3C31_04010 [Candidatus Roizmanbacteria bacterium RIFCSPHIGHO2_02_FULL_40_53]OGK58474.1 MAG: hypothetical protein A3H84_04205 [Candidatus Roizmanbacteria bacterium RIFCSPLOWO2_02_FULL_40_13]OGK60366.1 MAG: hypothetical protein A3G67_00610 [Candidatus Roizmanbacteria bacterium RIFCSPLOWO2_12_FULL_40_12]